MLKFASQVGKNIHDVLFEGKIKKSMAEIQRTQYITLNLQHLCVSLRWQSSPALSYNRLAQEGFHKCAFSVLRLNSEW